MSFERRPVHKDSKDKRVATTADNCRQLIQSGACSFPGDCGTDAEYLRHSSRTCAEPRRPSNQPKLAPRRRIDTYRDRSKSLSLPWGPLPPAAVPGALQTGEVRGSCTAPAISCASRWNPMPEGGLSRRSSAERRLVSAPLDKGSPRSIDGNVAECGVMEPEDPPKGHTVSYCNGCVPTAGSDPAEDCRDVDRVIASDVLLTPASYCKHGCKLARDRASLARCAREEADRERLRGSGRSRRPGHAQCRRAAARQGPDRQGA